ncbi:hypothetical protein RhiLY_09446 [Ceratobasidium sp. AG-Ba]|nr:hypothetical protein RhiLY_09446 [Ceratobasidium sp. AG-Ba]
MNNNLLTGNKPRYFHIEQHPYYGDMFVIRLVENKDYSLAMALERIFPPWVAMNNFPDTQAWDFKGVY